ncbi:MAG: T9SS type A sorting domain-containing protein, partial [Crocinitomicaceae bacterium]
CVQEETIFIDNLSTVGFEAIDLELNAYINNNRAIVNTTNPNIDHIELFNISGSNVANLRSTNWEQRERNIEFDFPYPSGVYIMVIHTQKDIFREKVIKP